MITLMITLMITIMIYHDHPHPALTLQMDLAWARWGMRWHLGQIDACDGPTRLPDGIAPHMVALHKET